MRTGVWLVSLALSAVAGCSSSPHSSSSCTSSANCPAGDLCVDSRCVAGQGDAGLCQSGCQCTSADACLVGAPSCVTASCVSGSCMFRTDDSRCGAGQSCDLFHGCTGGDAGGTPLDASADAGSDASSDAYVLPDRGPPDMNVLSPIGGPCTSSSSCMPIVGMINPVMCAMAESGFAMPGGYCTIQCVTFGGNTCPAGSECVSGGGGAGFCAATCTSSAECRTAEGYSCRQPRRSITGLLACLPPGL